MAPTVIAYNEIYNAIQNGVIQAAENEALGVEQMKFYEVGPNISLTQHAITIRPICFERQDVQPAAGGSAGRDLQGGQGGRRVRPQARIERGSRAAGEAGEGGQAEARGVHRPRPAAEAHRAGAAEYAKSVGAEAVFARINAIK